MDAVIPARDYLEHALRACHIEHDNAPPATAHYRDAIDFVLREGEWFVPAPLPPDVAPGFPRRCYHNAIMQSAIRGFPYVEGFAVNRHCLEHGLPPVPHAWNLNERGRAIDSTWLPAQGIPLDDRAYVGVRFSAVRAHEASWDGDASVLDDFNRGHPVFLEPWKAEESPGDTEGLLERMLADAQAEGALVDRKLDELAAGMRRRFGAAA